MSPQLDPRAGRALMALGALSTIAVAVPAAARAEGAPIRARVADHHLRYGEAVVVTGQLAGAPAGRAVSLEFRAPGAGWARVADAQTDAGGAYRLSARLPGSGLVRVVEGGPQARAASADQAPAASEPGPVSVAARLEATGRRIDVVAGRTVRVSGRVRPARAGREVRLERLSGGRWRAVARAVTRSSGRYVLRYRPARSGSALVRVRYPGTRRLAGASRGLGRMDVFRYAQASWYGPGLYGNRLGCGGRLTPSTLGVANKTLPCGTRVTLRYHGRTVRVAVVDRGPYVGGREFDLTKATKDRLGFRGHGAILTTR